jgi:hypothetical protein
MLWSEKRPLMALALNKTQEHTKFCRLSTATGFVH